MAPEAILGVGEGSPTAKEAGIHLEKISENREAPVATKKVGEASLASVDAGAFQSELGRRWQHLWQPRMLAMHPQRPWMQWLELLKRWQCLRLPRKWARCSWKYEKMPALMTSFMVDKTYPAAVNDGIPLIES
jgi:hypothetical protein